jgi:hypothetical protein
MYGSKPYKHLIRTFKFFFNKKSCYINYFSVFIKLFVVLTNFQEVFKYY